jgi:hypothetical protein
VFLYFIQAGARTLYSKNFELERGAFIGQFMFLMGGVIPIWFVGLAQPIHLAMESSPRASSWPVSRFTNGPPNDLGPPLRHRTG